MLEIIGIDPSYTNCGVSDGVNHIVVQTRPHDDQDGVENVKRRSLEICKAIAEFIGGRQCEVYVEAPMASSRGAMHLYEVGWLMNDLHRHLPQISPGIVSVNQVQTSTLRKWVTGKGNAAKDEMKLKVFKRFGVEFERDPGCDKLFAYILHRYGLAVQAGEIEAKVIARRGAGATALARQRARKSAA